MKPLLIAAMIVSGCVAHAGPIHRTIRVAVIDTGFDKNRLRDDVPLCDTGHKDFTLDGDPFSDRHGHGTHIAGTIRKFAGSRANYCLIIIKNYTPGFTSGVMDATRRAFAWAILQDADYINYSGGGTESDRTEHNVIKVALEKGIKIIVAAGNEGSNLNKSPYFPACYDSRIEMVQSTDESGDRLSSSNYLGPGTFVTKSCNNKAIHSELGSVSVDLKNGSKFFMQGTSQAAAVHTGKALYQLNTTQTIK